MSRAHLCAASRFLLSLTLLAVVLPASASEGPACTVPAELARFDHQLDHLLLRIEQGRPIKIVTIGSSSTAGAGASSDANTYPARLEAELKARLPGTTVTVLNKGVNGEEANQMIARFEADVIDEKPDLVIWQVGTNSVLRDHLTPGSVIRDGVERLKATGADVVLMNPQFAPKVIVKPDVERMIDIITATARDEGVEVFDRWTLMRQWHETQSLPFDQFVSADGLHLNDWSYGCIAKVIATAILDGVRLPIATAKMPAPVRTR